MVRDGADNLKRFTFELGGKAPHILFADADLDNAINAATASAWRLTKLRARLARARRAVDLRARRRRVLRAREVGARRHAVDRYESHGTQSHQAQLDKTLSYIEIGKQDGAELVAGGHRIATPGRRLLR